LLVSEDAQQADLARLILHQLDHPDDPDATVENFFFNTGIRNPAIERTSMYGYWDPEDFPGHDGLYPEREPRTEWAGADEEQEALEYTVQVEESLWEISRQFLVSSERLREINGLTLPLGARLPAGTILLIPPPEY
jgi:hypothetical protein